MGKKTWFIQRTKQNINLLSKDPNYKPNRDELIELEKKYVDNPTDFRRKDRDRLEYLKKTETESIQNEKRRIYKGENKDLSKYNEVFKSSSETKVSTVLKKQQKDAAKDQEKNEFKSTVESLRGAGVSDKDSIIKAKKMLANKYSAAQIKEMASAYSGDNIFSYLKYGTFQPDQTSSDQVNTPYAYPDNSNNLDRAKGAFSLADSSVNVGNLQPLMKSKFLNMAEDRFRKTGQPITVTSGWRSSEKQKELHDKYPWKAAKPGTSAHERGMALDTPDGDKLAREGYLNKYGFERKARMKGGALEPWHIAPAGTTTSVPGPQAVGDDMSNQPNFKVVAKYFNYAKSLIDNIDKEAKITPNFQANRIGKMVAEREPIKSPEVTGKPTKEITLLSDIKDLLKKSNQANNNEKQETGKASPTPPTSIGGAPTYKPLSECLPSGTLLTLYHNYITSFGGGY
jgi:LAS superfamily LD-carboxypeptidase LdcB